MINITSNKKLLAITFLLILTVAISTWAVFATYYFTLIIAIPIIVYCVYSIASLRNSTLNKISFMFDSIDCDDYSFNFKEHITDRHERVLNMSLNRIKDIMENAKHKAHEREKYYELIMNSVKTSVIIINDYGHVYQANNEAKKMFGLKHFNHIDQLQFIAPNLIDKLRSIKSGERTLLSFTNEIGEVSLSLHASEIALEGQTLKIISANDINNDLDEKEVESWSKLIRVLTHEIMNSLAPITSLSQALMDSHNEEEVTKGLEVINTTSKGLVEFVESYRKFTGIRIPEKYPFEVKTVLENIVKLVFNDDVRFTINVQPEDTMIYGDEKLVSQLILNIFKNASQAMTTTDNKQIDIDVFIDQNEKVVVKISNSGDNIPSELIDNIFTPFFTTKQTGSGVGLSIARQIMHLHGGEIKLTSNKKGCVTFSLIFI